MNNLQPLVTFLLGATAATVFSLFFLSSNPEERSFEILALRNIILQQPKHSHDQEEVAAGSIGEMQVVANGTKLMAPDKEDQEEQVNNNKGEAAAAAAAASEEQELVGILRAAAMDGDTVVLVIVTSENQSWAEPGKLLDVFLESFRVGERIEYLLNHLVIVVVNLETLARCKSLHPYCYYLRVGDAVATNKDYFDRMWSRNRFQQRILELGYNFLFTDVDILWFRNPFWHISPFAHITFSSDAYMGNPDDLRTNYPNGGFFYVKSCNKTIEFYKNWYLARDWWPGTNEQVVFNKIKRNFSAEYEVNIQFIDTAICGEFCKLEKNLSRICTVNVNCCIDLDNKVGVMRNLIKDWKNYTTLPPEEKKKGWFWWGVPGRCIP